MQIDFDLIVQIYQVVQPDLCVMVAWRDLPNQCKMPGTKSVPSSLYIQTFIFQTFVQKSTIGMGFVL